MIMNMTCTPENVHLYIGIYIYTHLILSLHSWGFHFLALDKAQQKEPGNGRYGPLKPDLHFFCMCFYYHIWEKKASIPYPVIFLLNN